MTVPKFRVAFRITRKLQEQAGSFFVSLPKFVVAAWRLNQGDDITLLLDPGGDVVVLSPEHSRKESN